MWRGFYRFARTGVGPIGDKALQQVNIERLVDKIAIAGKLAAVVTNAPTNARERVVFLNGSHGVRVTPSSDKRDVSLGALSGRTGIPARCDAALVDGVGIWHRLRVEFESCTLLRHPSVEFTGNVNRANRGAFAAGRAFGRVNKAGIAPQARSKVTGFPFDREDFRVGEDFDVEMVPNIDQFRGYRAHGAIVRWKRLVQLRHVSTDGGFDFGQVNLEALLCKIEAGLHPGDSAAYDQGCAGGDTGGAWQVRFCRRLWDAVC